MCDWAGPRTPRKLDFSSLSREQREAMNEPSPRPVLTDPFAVIHCVLIATSKELRKRTTQKRARPGQHLSRYLILFEDPLLSEPARLKSPLLVLAGPGSGKTHFLVKT